MTDHDAEAAEEALQALGLVPGARLLSPADLVLSLVPREDGLQPKDVPVEQVLTKITMMRDKLRVLEQRVNAAEGVGVAERAQLQAQITAVYNAFAGLAAFFSVESLPNAETTTTTTATTTAPTATTTTGRA